jgi:hypothetical protein
MIVTPGGEGLLTQLSGSRKVRVEPLAYFHNLLADEVAAPVEFGYRFEVVVLSAR